MMTLFEQSEWHDQEKSRAYRDNADHLIQDRQRLLQLLGSFFKTYSFMTPEKNILDLGCGDGILGYTLKSMDPAVRLSLWDGSSDMIEAARKRFAMWPDIRYKTVQFDELLDCKVPAHQFDWVISSMAIHHIAHHEKRGLLAQIHHMLKPDGYFMNIDVALPDHPVYEAWYNEIWRDWLRQRKERFNLEEDILNTPERARAKPENRYELLSTQLQFLKDVGFRDVECHYKSGLFTMYGGRK